MVPAVAAPVRDTKKEQFVKNTGPDSFLGFFRMPQTGNLSSPVLFQNVDYGSLISFLLN